MFGIKVPDADEAMIISGGKGGDDGTPFKVVIGTKSFVPPVIRRVSFMTLAMQEAEVAERCVTQKGITLEVQAVIAFKVANDVQSIINAAQRFLSDQRQMPVLTGRIFAGHLRSIVGSMTVEQIIMERQKLATEVLDASKEEMAKLGLLVDSLQISSIDDIGTGYIEAISAPQRAMVQQQAKVAQAEADRAAAEAAQKSAQAQAQYARQTAEVEAQQASLQAQAKAKADSEAAVAAANAQASSVEAEQESQKRQAAARQAALDAQTALAEQQAELRQQQLVGEVIKPAQAEAEKVRVAAAAEADATRLQAEAAASHDRVALDRMLIEQMPLIVREASAGLANSRLTILNGSDGLSDMASGLLAQGLQIFNNVRESGLTQGPEAPRPQVGGELPSPGPSEPADGEVKP
ncbi:MAG: SPFH domain-containing protein [Alphaproteobacteria bacterium]|nr:SPFH domain-containing protein [Alphaproteobacteria bacterium]